MDCLVRNLSQNGAKLVFATPVLVPEEFDVQIHNKGDSRRARIIWRTETEMGIIMIPSELRSVISIETARRIKSLEFERSTLEKRVAELSEPS